MPKVPVKVTDIGSLTPAIDARNANQVFALDGKNFVFDSKGPKSGFGTRLLAGLESLDGENGKAQSITVGDRTFVATLSGVYELTGFWNRTWTRRLDLSARAFLPEDHTEKWTSAFLGNARYACHPRYGFFVIRKGEFIRRTQEDVPGLPREPIAITESNGRLLILNHNYITWSAPAEGENFNPELGGAGMVYLPDRVSGRPRMVTPFQHGFLVWTDTDCMIAEFIGGDLVYRFDRMQTEYIPLDMFCVENYGDGSAFICTEQGIFRTENGGVPENLTPVFNEFLRGVLEHEPGIHIRLTYEEGHDRLYVQTWDHTWSYLNTYVLSVSLDKWGFFNDRHLGIIHYGSKRGQDGYVDVKGVAHKFVDTFNREVSPGVLVGLDSWMEIGYIRPNELIGEVDTLQEMHELTLGGRPIRPSWDPQDIHDLGELETIISAYLYVTPILDVEQRTQQWNITIETPVYFEVSHGIGTVVNLDNGDMFDFFSAYPNGSSHLRLGHWVSRVSTNLANADTYGFIDTRLAEDPYVSDFTQAGEMTTMYDRYTGGIGAAYNQGDSWISAVWSPADENYVIDQVDAGHESTYFIGASETHWIFEQRIDGDLGISVRPKTDLSTLSWRDVWERPVGEGGIGEWWTRLNMPYFYAMLPGNRMVTIYFQRRDVPGGVYDFGHPCILRVYDMENETATQYIPWGLDTGFFGESNTDVGVTTNNTHARNIWFDRARNELVILWGYMDNDWYPDETSDEFFWSTFPVNDLTTETYYGRFPQTGYFTSEGDSVSNPMDADWHSANVTGITGGWHWDCLPFPNEDMNLFRTIERLSRVVDGELVDTGYAICVRDPNLNFRVIHRYWAGDALNPLMDDDEIFEGNQFLNELATPPALRKLYYTPNGNFAAGGGSANIFDWAFENLEPESETYNSTGVMPAFWFSYGVGVSFPYGG